MASFLPDEFFNELPASRVDAWTQAAKHGAAYIDAYVHQDSDATDDENRYNEVVGFLFDLAKELNIDIFDGSTEQPHNLYDRYRFLMASASRISGRSSVARIAANYTQSRELANPVLMSGSTKMEIINLSRDLKKTVSASDLENQRKTRLLKGLEQFEQDLISGQTGLKEAALAIAVVAGSVATATGTLAAAPAALETLGKISGLLGYEIEQSEKVKELEEEAATLAITGPNEHGKSSPK